MNIKKTMITIAAVGLTFTASFSQVFAKANPKTNGSIVYTALGTQRYASFDAHQTGNCMTNWNVSGNYTIGFTLANDSSEYVHDATLTQTGTSVSGSGGYPAGSSHSYAWNVTSGTVSGSTVNLTVTYTYGAPGTVMNMIGTIAPDGTLSGTWDDNYGGSRNGTWMTKTGTATVSYTSCTGKGQFKYADVNGDWYVVKVTCAYINGSDAVFSGPVTYASNPAWTTNWLIAKVHDAGTPGTKGDTVSGDFVTNDPQCNAASIVNGPFTVTAGNLVVHK